MQIHEMDPFIGELSDDTVLAIDDGTETMKIPANSLGITQKMTLAEAEAGSSTEPRVITPVVLNQYAHEVAEAVVSEKKVLVIEYSINFSSLPLTISNTKITTDMRASKLVLSNPSAQTGSWEFNTDTAGEVVITGSISGTTQIQELWLEPTQ